VVVKQAMLGEGAKEPALEAPEYFTYACSGEEGLSHQIHLVGAFSPTCQ